MKKLRLKGDFTEKERGYALEAALLLGFQAESAVFPVYSEEGELEVPKSDAELAALWELKESKVPDGYVPAEKKGPVFELDFRKKKGLEYLFSRGMFLKDEDFDLLPDKLDVKLILPEDADISMLRAACNVAFRFGMETTACEGGILAGKGYEGNAVIFEPGERVEMVFEELAQAVRVHIRGRGKELEEFTSRVCEKFPFTSVWKSWRDVLMEMTDDFVLRGADGQLACMHALRKEKAENYILYGAPEIRREQVRHFPEAEFRNYKSGEKVYEQIYELPWEVDTFEQIVTDEILPAVKPGDRIRIAGALSEDKKIRRSLEKRLEKKLEESGARVEEFQIFCAYKQGFSWIDEYVVPAAEGQKIQKVEIFFRPFLPEGETRWLDENGATPSYHNLEAENPDKWYDLPIRFLQELYPVQDVLKERLGVREEDILFKVYEGREELTYLCRITDEEGKVREFRYLARYSERAYLDEYPQMGKVHPSTGYIKVWINNEERLGRRIATDLENVWEIYQNKVLPKCRDYIKEKAGGQVHAAMQPFFQELRLKVWASEPDYRTGSREDLISSLDALHEDMYFVGSDYFKNYGLQECGEIFDAPGLILPEIHSREGAPVLHVVLYQRLMEEACILCGKDVAAKERDRNEISLRLVRLLGESGRLSAEIAVEGVSDELLEAYAALFSEGILESSRQMSSDYCLRFLGDSGNIYEASVPAKAEVPAKAITDINLHETELISYEMYRGIIEELRGVKGVEVFRTAYSYQGRELYGIWLKPQYEGYLSMTKRLSRLPSEIINTRHHANEVSGTNAAFMLLKTLLTEEKYRELPEKLNLVIVPMENVDGAAIHYELQKEHPYWKFHVARFNAVGKEFYHDHFRQDTIHREAMGLTRLYEKYVPDMIVDNHGVPSHEWEQQFSGYTSPSYKGFWLPRSLLYGYFWYVTDEEYKGNFSVNKKMEDVIADRIAEDEEMTRWNREWSVQFEKYAHAWLPKLFPADYYKDMINYWIPFAFDEKHRYPSIRFPWITTVAYTSEVADETAQGEYLSLCARAHAAHDEAAIQMLLKAEHVFAESFRCRKGQIFAEYLRQRPMLV